MLVIFTEKKGHVQIYLRISERILPQGLNGLDFFVDGLIFFLSRAAVGAVFLGVCGFRHYQLVVLQDFTWPIPRHQCTK